MKRSAFLAVFISVVSICSYPQMSRSCETILANGIHDESHFMGYDHHASAFRDWACNSGFTSASSMEEEALKFGLRLKSLPVGIELSKDDEKYVASLNEWCDVSHTVILEDSFISIHARSVSEALVSAFNSCLESERAQLLQQGAFAYAKRQMKL